MWEIISWCIIMRLSPRILTIYWCKETGLDTTACMSPGLNHRKTWYSTLLSLSLSLSLLSTVAAARHSSVNVPESQSARSDPQTAAGVDIWGGAGLNIWRAKIRYFLVIFWFWEIRKMLGNLWGILTHASVPAAPPGFQSGYRWAPAIFLHFNILIFRHQGPLQSLQLQQQNSLTQLEFVLVVVSDLSRQQ